MAWDFQSESFGGVEKGEFIFVSIFGDRIVFFPPSAEPLTSALGETLKGAWTSSLDLTLTGWWVRHELPVANRMADLQPRITNGT